VLRRLLKICLLIIAITACGRSTDNKQDIADHEKQIVNLYTHRHYDVDQKLFKSFTEQTNIKVNVVNASADELIQKLELEGENSSADVLITVDAGRLYRAKEKGLLQSVTSQKLENNVPSQFRDPGGFWYGLTYRARVIAYSKERVNVDELSIYEDLINPKWKGKILIRSSGNIYNQSLLASIIAANGSESAKAWARGVVDNMARSPKGNDRDQVKAIAAGEGDLAIVNTYYIGRLLHSQNNEEVKAGETVKIFFPNQNGRGTHINVSGAGVTRYAPHKENAIKLIEFLSADEAQSVFAHANFEYPVKIDIEPHELLKLWGEFKTDTVNLSLLGEYNKQAVMIFDEVGWK